MTQELKSTVERNAEKAENLSFCSGIKLLHIRKNVQELLSFIGKGGIFEEYTVHSIDHVDEMLKIIEWLIPKETQDAMTKAEWLMLTLAVYFHDLGMVVTRDEYNNRNNSSFRAYKNSIFSGDSSSEYKEFACDNDRFLYQEFVRENHAKRIKLWIEGKEDIQFGDAESVRTEISNMLANLDNMFKTDLAKICESHHKDDIEDFSKYKIKVHDGNDDEEIVNLNYIAIILRIADLLHITKDRTPSIARRIINVSNPVSVLEWEKQKAVRAVQPQPRRNAEGNIDDTLEKNTIEITAYFDGAETAEAYFGLSAYLQYTKRELEKCCDIVAKAQKTEGAVSYKFPWNKIDESQITAVGFEPKKLQFTIAQENILQLLVGHTLYNDSSVVVRELTQNGIDAVKLQKYIEQKADRAITQGRIDVEWNPEERELSFFDNGTGMTIQDVEKYLLKVGASKYREQSVKKEFPDFHSISHFGIGILTCFMVANDIDIVTSSEEQPQANIINLRQLNGSYLLRKIGKKEIDSRIQLHGTMVKLHIRSDVNIGNPEDDLKRWIVLPEVPVFYTEAGKKPVRIGYDSLGEILVKYLNDSGWTVDKEQYDVWERTHRNVTIAFAVKHMKYLSDWSLMNVNFSRFNSKKSLLPIGTCVEGIRVEFTTPGYKTPTILAIANIKNSKYQTNVARSAIELDPNKEIICDIYDVFAQYIQEQMQCLEKNGYSKTWAISEGGYLMDPLIVNDSSNYRVDPVDEEILTQRLATLKCLILENEGKRETVSAIDAADKEEINIFECQLTRAAENLLQEIRSEASLKRLVEVVSSEENFLDGVANVVCNFNPHNVLHEYALRNKEVTHLQVNRKQRMIRLTYKNQNELWDSFDLGGRLRTRRLFIPKKEFIIEGLEDEIGVNTRNGIFLRSDCEVYSYIRKVIAQCSAVEDMDENQQMLEAFFSSVFDSHTLETKFSENINPNSIISRLVSDDFFRLSSELLSKIWSYIDVEEFKQVILTKKYFLYSIDNWTRSEINL